MFFYYIVQFIMCIAACNFYSDISRYHICQREDGSYIRGEEASLVYDNAIYMAGIFHIIEWIRTTLLNVVICIGVDLVLIWYWSGLFSGLYGLICLFVVHYDYLKPDGVACGAT